MGKNPNAARLKKDHRKNKEDELDPEAKFAAL